MRILVISDLHIGEKARGKDLCPNGSNKWLDENYKQDFINYIRRENIAANYIVITGDISDSATPEQFEVGYRFVKEIADVANVPYDNILIVPGNHDVDWRILDIAENQTGRSLEYRKKHRYDSLIDGFNNEFVKTELINEPYYYIWDFADLLVVGFNSAWNDEKNVKVHNGEILNATIEDIETDLLRKNINKEKIKLFITHHHLFQFSDPISQDPDYSIMINAENILQMLSRNRFDMIIHGHKHIPRIKTLEMDSLHPLSLLCAGSFSVILDQRLSGCVLNSFHLVHFEGRDTKTDRIYGYVENYSFSSPHKWLKSEKSNSSVLFKHGFGSYSNIKQLKGELIPLITEIMRARGSLVWSTFCQDNRKLLYHTPEFITQLTDEIAKDLEIFKYAAGNEIIFTSYG